MPKNRSNLKECEMFFEILHLRKSVIKRQNAESILEKSFKNADFADILNNSSYCPPFFDRS